jgi:hypothetical protein
MPSPIPGGNEPGYLAFAILDGLLNLLVTKGTITADDRSGMLKSFAARLSQDANFLGQRSAEFITKSMLR